MGTAARVVVALNIATVLAIGALAFFFMITASTTEERWAIAALAICVLFIVTMVFGLLLAFLL